ncbi:MAG: hypothetical protein IJ301_04000 [Clostridia bacterium]|nr:hypothetical protein [Clostridia bacterium]
MKLKDFIYLFKQEYKVKVLKLEELSKFLPRPDYYGEKMDIATITEGEICSDNFVVLKIKRNNLDPNGVLEENWCVNQIIVFAEFDGDMNVINTSMLSSFKFKSEHAENHFYHLLDCYKHN